MPSNIASPSPNRNFVNGVLYSIGEREAEQRTARRVLTDLAKNSGDTLAICRLDVRSGRNRNAFSASLSLSALPASRNPPTPTPTGTQARRLTFLARCVEGDEGLAP